MATEKKNTIEAKVQTFHFTSRSLDNMSDNFVKGTKEDDISTRFNSKREDLQRNKVCSVSAFKSVDDEEDETCVTALLQYEMKHNESNIDPVCKPTDFVLDTTIDSADPFIDDGWISNDIMETSCKPFEASDHLTPLGNPKQNRRKKIQTINPFIDFEADASDGFSESEDTEEGSAGFDTSFLDDEPIDPINESQRLRYIESLKELVPSPIIPVLGALDCVIDSQLADDVGEYEFDSFCVAVEEEDEVASIGEFTQAMIDAKQQIESEPSVGVKTRRHAKDKENKTKPIKRRRRIIIQSDSSD